MKLDDLLTPAKWIVRDAVMIEILLLNLNEGMSEEQREEFDRVSIYLPNKNPEHLPSRWASRVQWWVMYFQKVTGIDPYDVHYGVHFKEFEVGPAPIKKDKMTNDS